MSETFKTLQVISMLNMFAEEMEKGHVSPFSKATAEMKEESRDYIFYDDMTVCERGGGQTAYPIVCDSLIDELHDDIISYWPCDMVVNHWGDMGYEVVYVDDGCDTWIEVIESDGHGLVCVDAKNGWYWVW